MSLLRDYLLHYQLHYHWKLRCLLHRLLHGLQRRGDRTGLAAAPVARSRWPRTAACWLADCRSEPGEQWQTAPQAKHRGVLLGADDLWRASYAHCSSQE